MGEDVALQKKAEPAATVAPAPPQPAADQVQDPLTDPLAAKKDGAPPQEARTKEGTAAGRADYQRLLGDSLGDTLYGAVAPHLTMGAISGYATKGLDAALVALAGQLGSLKGDVDPAAVKAFSAQLGQSYGPLAADFMKTDFGKKIGEGMADWVDANPEMIVGIALLAAAAAIASDMKIPELKQKLNLGGGFEAELAAKLGSLRNIVAEELAATVRYQSESVKASLTVRNDKEGVAVDTSAKVGGDEAHVEATATMTENGLEVAGLKGLQRTAAGDVSGGIEKGKGKEPVVKVGLTQKADENTTVTNSVKYDAGNSAFTMGREVAFAKDGNTAKASQSASTDGSQQAGIEVGRKFGGGLSANLGASQQTAADGQQTSAFKGGLAYDGGKLKANATAEAQMGQTTAYKVGGAMTYEDNLNKARLGYQYDSAKGQHDVSAMGQVGVTDKTAIRGSAQHTADGQDSETKIGAHAAHFTTKDLGLFGGGTYELNSKGKSTFVPEVGVQVKGVPVKVGFDPSDKSWRVGVTIPF